MSGATDRTWTYLDGDKILDLGSYRYLRIYNSASWNGNIAEVEFYGDYDKDAELVIESLEPVSISTVAGTATVLPTVVNAVYSDETTKPVAVKWETIDPSLNSTTGSFTVTGAVLETDMQAVANVTVVEENVLLPTNVLSTSKERSWNTLSVNAPVTD